MKNLLATLITITAATLPLSSQAADYSAGATFGSTGLGLGLSLKNNLHFRDDDQVQTRLSISGFSADDIDDLEFSGIDYEGDFDTRSARATMDWYPFDNRFFVSAGLDYSKYDIDLDAETSQSYNIGRQPVNPGDNVTTRLEIDDKGVAPYFGIGWGNRISEDSGFSFLAELGVLIPTGDPDVDLTVTDPGNLISAADIAAEKKQIEDELDGALAVASIGVMYHF